MPDLRALGQEVVDHPFREPTPVELLQGRAQAYVRRRQRLMTISSVGVALLMVAALIGVARSASGASGAHQVVAVPTTAAEETSTTAVSQAEETTTSVAASSATTASAGGATATTAKAATSATTAKKSSTATTVKVVAKPATQVVGGITNLLSVTTTAPSGPTPQAGG